MANHVFMKGNMITDPSLQREIIERVKEADLPDTPDRLAHNLGKLEVPDGTTRTLFVRHAVDALLTDPAENVVLITRRYPPAAGRLAIPGGFLDDVHGQVEPAEAAARRELEEETGIEQKLLGEAQLQGIGWRRYDRPFDVRAAWADLPDTGIKQGDIFMVSTQPVYLRTESDLSQVKLAAADDATNACVMGIGTLTPDTLGIPDQLGMIKEIPKKS